MSIFEPRQEEVSEDRRKVHNEEIHKLYSSGISVRVIK
jgi:hypothetical protein